MKNTCLLAHCILSFEGTSYNRMQDIASLPIPLFLVVYVTSEFTSDDIIFDMISFLISFLTFTEPRLKKFPEIQQRKKIQKKTL